MLDLLRKTYLAGLGLASLTREKMEEIVDELVKRGEVAEKDRRTVLEDLLKRAREEQRHFSQSIREGVRKVVGEMRVPSREQYSELLKRIEELEKRAHSHRESERGNASTSQGN
jgi:polyhydroxyalkanoate synthesis regulator phasin